MDGNHAPLDGAHRTLSCKLETFLRGPSSVQANPVGCACNPFGLKISRVRWPTYTFLGKIGFDDACFGMNADVRATQKRASRMGLVIQ